MASLRALIFSCGCVLIGCSKPVVANLSTDSRFPAAEQTNSCQSHSLTFSENDPQDEQINIQQLINLTEWVQSNPQIPILSITVSKNGHVFYQLLTSSLSGQEAHYLMSATKSVTSSLVGIAIDKSHLKGTDQVLTDILPPNLFISDSERGNFSHLSIKNILGMSALYAPVPPHQNTSDDQQRFNAWFSSPNRVGFALTQPLVTNPGSDFFYTDITPSLAAGAVEYTARMSLLDFANQNLFAPMEFKNQEWMHEDPDGVDNGAYGLRLRPIDMQKFGVLFLNGGCWNGRQLISENWVTQSFTPWITSGENTYSTDYGWYWWYNKWSPSWISNGAVGWKGQRIEVFPQQQMVVTMTAIINDGSENKIFSSIIHNYIIHLNDPIPTNTDLNTLKQKLQQDLIAVNSAPSRIAVGTETRMIPTVANKENHIPFAGH